MEPDNKEKRAVARILLVRHGESRANAGFATSEPADVPLTDLGHQQALDVADQINETPDLIVVSPYKRTQQTAVPLRRRYPDAPYEVWPIQEFTFLTPGACVGLDAGQRRPIVEAYWARGDMAHVDGEGAESFNDFTARVVEFDDRLTARDGLVVVVGHEQFFRTYLLGRTNDFTYTLADMSGIGDNTYPPRIPNGHIHRIETTAPSTTARRRAQATTHGWPVAPTRSTRRRQQ